MAVFYKSKHSSLTQDLVSRLIAGLENKAALLSSTENQKGKKLSITNFWVKYPLLTIISSLHIGLPHTTPSISPYLPPEQGNVE